MPMGYGGLGDRGTTDALVRRYQLEPNYTFNLSPEVVATASLGDMPEIRYHMGWMSYQRVLTVGPVAAQFGRVQLRAASFGIMVIVERILVSTSVAIDVNVALGGAPDLGGSAQRGVARDLRQPASFSTAIMSSDTNAVAVSPSYFDGFGAANIGVEVAGAPWIFTDVNDAIILSVGPVNTGFSCTMVWRERRMNDQENVP